ncbi:ABC transporter ATP-binding protein [Ethanoligenens harbinense]|uniref:ABC transporter ATP-binding protein n=1 Tax=Ethanoligenens harbinense TaxID=253239 RepID=UPI00242E0002|nr:ABC transporter ATP-binding protein [Ethanoligenens harbinense]
MLGEISIIKSFVKEKTILANLLRLQNDTYQVRLKRNAAANIANTALSSGGYYLALVFGALQIADGKISYGMLTEFLLVFNQVIDPFKSMSGILLQFFSVTASAERLMEIEILCDEPEPKSKQADAENIYREMNCIRIDRISFQYGAEQVFKNASRVIKKNTLTAIVGCSEVGKSTLLKLMLGLVEADSGEIRIEMADKNRRINTETRRLFSYVPQGNMILSGTIKENITFFREWYRGKDASGCLLGCLRF